MTRTFANKEELMIALLQGEKWRSETDSFDSWCEYSKNREQFLFRYCSPTKNVPISGLYYCCDGKTLWHKVEEKPKKKTISLAMFSCYNKNSKEWVRVNVCESLQKFIEIYSDKSNFINHHEITNTRYLLRAGD